MEGLKRSTFTITYGDVAENHVGMQKIGDMASKGFAPDDLQKARKLFEKGGFNCITKNLNNALPDDITADKATVLVVKEGLRFFCDIDVLFKELEELNWDTKVKMYGRVCNKHARYNLCFGDENQEPDYENGKGRVISFADVDLLRLIREKLSMFLGEKGENLMAEGNYYYDSNKCGIGFHGDAERKKVVAFRLGSPIPLHYQWYQNSKPIGKRVRLRLQHGDLYIMSEKASGYDWKKKSIPTLRHAAGAKKFIK